jgi:hypothetical protein
MQEKLARHRCIGDDGTPLVVIEWRHVREQRGAKGVRRQIGARRLALEDGAEVRVIDATLFEVVASGELLRRIE